MDAVEAARQAAARLHAEAVDRGGDPRRPLEFARAEAERLGFEVTAVMPGSSYLNGARAALLAEDGMIYHESVEDPFEAAILVAHEIGHAVLGDGDGACEVDAERSSEAAPVGVERVVEHGPRQRREIQMDLFAREFLMPRSIVRTMHVDQGQSASDIAASFAAPVRVVALQLLDALLLPPVPSPAEGPKRTPPPLNGEQAAAAAHRGTAYLLGAGPGTGKTRTLAARVAGLLAEGVDPRRMLVVTFSNKAAGELSQRIAGGHADAFAAMWIGTFHAFGLDVLRSFGDRIGVGRNPRMLDGAERVELLEDIFPRLELPALRDVYDPTDAISSALDAISRAQDELKGPGEYARLAAAMLERAQDEEERLRARRMVDVAVLYERYDTLKRQGALADFGDLVMQPVLLFGSHEEVRRHYAGRFAHVLVDEYQDVNRASVGLLKALAPDGRGLWAVGDVRQSIYRWRGASSHNMALFSTDFPGAARGSLEVNYRSTAEIVSAFTGFSRTMTAGSGDPSRLRSAREGSAATPTLRTVRDKTLEAASIAEAVEEHVRGGATYRDQCVLCSGNERLAAVGRGLEALGVPVLHLGSLFERDAVRDLLSMLLLLTDPRGMGLVRTACMPEFAMSMADVDAALRALRQSSSGRPWWLDAPDTLAAELSPEGGGAVIRLAAALCGFDAASPPWDVLTAVLLNRTAVGARLASGTTAFSRSEAMAVWQFLNFVRAQPAPRKPRVPALLSRVRRLMRLADDRELRQLPAAAAGLDAVRLMTIHGAKGLEFPVVHLPGLNDGTMPRRCQLPDCPAPDGLIDGERGSGIAEFRSAHDEEQECLLYVAMSRAEDRLELYACTHTTDGKSRKLSDYVDRIGPGLHRSAVQPSRLPPPAPDELPVPVRFGGELRFAASRLALLDGGCARRFFYAHVLLTGGRRETTPYTALHDAVRKLCERLVRTGEDFDEAKLGDAILVALETEGLGDSGFLPEFKVFAAAMLGHFLRSRAGLERRACVTLEVAVAGGRVLVTPDDLLVGPDGEIRARRVRTGHHRKKDADDVTAAALVIAARQAHAGAEVDVLHLADGTVTPVALTPVRLKNARGKLEKLIATVRAGDFPTSRSARTCPSCPALFICDALPPGELQRI